MLRTATIRLTQARVLIPRVLKRLITRESVVMRLETGPDLTYIYKGVRQTGITHNRCNQSIYQFLYILALGVVVT
jgi:hypothetical protein